MTRWIPLLTVVTACGAPAAAPVVPTAEGKPVSPPAKQTPADETLADDVAIGIDWSTATYGTDEEALALWAQLKLTGADFEVKVGEIPESPAGLSEAMAKALLRAGNFSCPVDLGPQCVGSEIDREMLDYQLREIPDDATLDDPCMRRVIALWAIDQLDDDDLSGELAADAIALAALPWPERELNRAVMYRVQDSQVKLNMIAAAQAAGNDEIADEMLGGLDLDDLKRLAIDHHIDGAVFAVGAGNETLPIFEAAVVDAKMTQETRVGAVRELAAYAEELADRSAPDRVRAVKALEAARVAPDCVTAGAAARALDTLGERKLALAPTRPTAADTIRWLCMQRGAELDDPLAPWVKLAGPAGVVIERRYQDPYVVHQLRQENPDVPDADGDGLPDLPRDELDPDGDGDPTTWTEVERVAPGDFADEVSASWDELHRAITQCDGTTCKVAGTHVTWQLVFGKSKKGGVVLQKLIRSEVYADC